MKILYIVNGLGFSKDMPIGGADKRVAEIGERLSQRGFEISVLTTDEGGRVLEDNGLRASFIVTKNPHFWRPDWFRSLIGRAVSYIYLTVASHRSVSLAEEFDVIYPSSDYFFDLIPALLLKKRMPKAKTIGIIHHHIELPWNRRGSFFQGVILTLTQRLDFLFLRFFDLILIPNTFESKAILGVLSASLPTGKIKYFENGINGRSLKGLPEVEKRFEGCFLGGFRPSKGILDLIPIWKRVCEFIPSAKILVIGGGTEDYEKRIKREVEENGLSLNFSFSGVLPASTLMSFVKSCRVFLSPSYEEGWGIAILEAMACGLPAVCYSIPAFEMYGDVPLKAPLGDKELFAKLVVRLLSDASFYREKVLGSLSLAGKWDWDRACELEEKTLLDLKQ